MASRVPPLLCTDPDDIVGWSQQVVQQLNDVVENGVPGGSDAFTVYGDTGDSTPDVLAAKIENPSTYDSGSHQLVYQETVDTGGVKTIQLFTDKGVGAADNYTVKIDSGSTAGYLDAKIHADTYEAADTYNASTHRIVLAAPVSDALRFYVATDLIKITSGDASPGFLFAKLANHSTYSASTHTLSYVEDLGSTVRIFTPISALNTIIANYLSTTAALGAVRFCHVGYGDVTLATESGGEITPGTCATMTELVRNGTSGHLEESGTVAGVIYPYSEPDYIISGRWKLGTLVPFQQDPTKLCLLRLPCRSYAE
jgi:hypothetical protein